MTRWLDTSRPLPYCPGCGHPHVLHALDAALASSDVPHERVVLVTDIGCVGLADAHFPSVHTVHALHGRAAALAVGMQAASTRPMKPIVLVGDGGASIGLLHLVHAAQLDLDVTVLVHNNLLYGMTGGQASTLTPRGLATLTTLDGCALPPVDLHRILTGAGATFFARERAPGAALDTTLAAALGHPGFACVEILELCPSFAAKRGGMTGKKLDALAADRTGILHCEAPRPAAPSPAADSGGPKGLVPNPAWARLGATRRLVLAGKAGEHVQSAARLAAGAAGAAGLFATVRTDNPVTQGKGFSLAELILSPDPVGFTGMPRPDCCVVLAPEGRDVLGRKGLLALASEVPFLVDEGLEGIEGVRVDRRPLRRRYGPKGAALGALREILEEEPAWAPEAWDAAMAPLPPRVAEEARRTLLGA